MTTYCFHAVPLTPVHIGDGSHLSPEHFLIDGDHLLRFHPTRVIADMPPARQQQYIDALGAGKLKRAQALIRQSVDLQSHVFERISIGAKALNYLRSAVDNPADNPDRRGEASPFVRMAGRPFVPGSSLKGAFRTALVSDRANADPARIEARIGQRLNSLNSEKSREISDDLQQLALDYDRGVTEGDPFRDVSIADALLRPDATRFDKVSVGWTPRRRDDPGKGRQLHVERLLSLIDRRPPAAVAFTVTVSLIDPEDQQRRQKLNAARTPRAPVTLRPLIAAVHAFHQARWQDEMERLFPEGSTVRRRLNEARATAENYARTLRPAADLGGIAPVLLRLGRFTGFESKSVETWRRGWRAPKRDRDGNKQPGQRIERAGTHSMLVDGADAIPFGWLLLCPASSPVADPPAPVPQGPRPGASAPQPAPPKPPTPPPARRAFVDDQEVEILERRGGDVLVRFIDSNDTDWVDASEIRYE